LVVVAETDATIAELNDLVISGKDAKGNELDDETASWSRIDGNAVVNENRTEFTFVVSGETYTALSDMTWGEFIESDYNPEYECSCGEMTKMLVATGEDVYHTMQSGCCGIFHYVFDENSDYVSINDKIIPNHVYSED
jgi:hypothetical protein